jgi:hypothetical protein
MDGIEVERTYLAKIIQACRIVVVAFRLRLAPLVEVRIHPLRNHMRSKGALAP